MKPHIDPKVDCVFKAILGREENKFVLLHFLNAVLQRESGRRVREVDILNPYNEREFETDKLSIVDIKAVDEQGQSYQIEIQLALHPGLAARILYTWCTIYHRLLGKGDNFTALRPVIAIWLLNESLFPALQASHLPFVLMNPQHGVVFSDHLQIHLLQLPDWKKREEPVEELDRWMYFFTEGEELDVEHPPAILQTQEMTKAMQVLRHFSENQREYLLYQKRLDAERVEHTWQQEPQRAREEAAQAKRRARQAKQREQQAEQERREQERLRRLLKQAGIDPDLP